MTGLLWSSCLQRKSLSGQWSRESGEAKTYLARRRQVTLLSFFLRLAAFKFYSYTPTWWSVYMKKHIHERLGEVGVILVFVI
jgi:hypothetical protein